MRALPAPAVPLPVGQPAPDFAQALVSWQARCGRHGLPWQGTRDPYRVWLSEIMLQQTQVATVIPYFERFLARFPELAALASAPLEHVLERWAGLGYYARARQAHACAKKLMTEHGGRFPQTAAQLEQLPGIGPSTAAAIAAFCYAERVAILDANVKRVLARQHAIEGELKSPAVLAQLWERARAALPDAGQMGTYTQAIMDLGATVCTRSRPLCGQCPVSPSCAALALGRVDDLPGRTPAPPRPERTAHLLLALHRRAVLVEERPPHGIWGGLLSLPQYDSATALRTGLRDLGIAAKPQALAGRRHGFTHYTLAYTPQLVQLVGKRPAPADRREAQTRRRWLALTQLESAALPAPVRGLLRELRDGTLAPSVSSKKAGTAAKRVARK